MSGKGTTYVDKRTGEVYQGNNPFFQFYEHNFKLILWMVDENPTALKIFLWLVRHMDGKNALVISQAALGEALGLHRSTIHRCVKFLVEQKCLSVFKSGNTNVYAINADIVWKNTHENKKFALFDSKVYLSWNEQDENVAEFKTQLLGHAIKVSKNSNASSSQNSQPKKK